MYNRVYIGFLIINALYAVMILSTQTIFGAGYTAPFSGWSLGGYWAASLPLSMITVLFMLMKFSPGNVDAIISSSVIKPLNYTLARITSVTIGLSLIILILYVLAALFTAVLFNKLPLYDLAFTMLLTAVPCYLITLGIGYIFKSFHSVFLYVLMIFILLIGFFPVNNYLDFFCGGYFSSEPILLPKAADGEPEFSLSFNFIVTRIIYFTIGLFVLLLSARKSKFKRI